MTWADWVVQPKITDWLSSLGALVGPIVAAAGFYFLYGQLRASTEQANTAAKNFKLSELAALRAADEAGERQNWKKQEFLAVQVKEFYADQRIERAIYMLDWAVRRFKLDDQTMLVVHDHRANDYARDHEQDYEKLMSSHKVALLTDALRKHDSQPFKDLEIWIRDEFDWLFFRLGQFQHMIEAKLFTFDEVDVHLKYLLDLLSGGKRHVSSDAVKTIAAYLEIYDFEATKKLTDCRIEARNQRQTKTKEEFERAR